MKRVLIADDSAFMRMSVTKMLAKHGYEVIGEASNGREAVEKYKELSPDIVTLDITMEEMTGLEALQAIKEYDANANVLMCSAMGQERIIQEAMDAGANGFLVKPFRAESVISTMSSLFAGG